MFLIVSQTFPNLGISIRFISPTYHFIKVNLNSTIAPSATPEIIPKLSSRHGQQVLDTAKVREP